MTAEADYRKHQAAGRDAVRLELEGNYTAAARVWQMVATSAPFRRWRQFAGKRARHCRNRQLCRTGQY